MQHPLAAGWIVESYRRLSLGLLAALRALGLDAEAGKRAEPIRSAGPICFEVPSDYEITIKGKKLIGSAQVRKQGGLLQHGSLPLCGDLGRICEVLSFASEAELRDRRVQVRVSASCASQQTKSLSQPGIRSEFAFDHHLAHLLVFALVAWTR